MPSIGKLFLGLGILFILVGSVIILGSKLGLDKLPGDILIRRGKVTFFFPVVTSIVISLVLTILLNLLNKTK